MIDLPWGYSQEGKALNSASSSDEEFLKVPASFNLHEVKQKSIWHIFIVNFDHMKDIILCDLPIVGLKLPLNRNYFNSSVLDA